MRRAIVPWPFAADVAVCLFFAAFVAARAVRVPLTYDEAASYLRYIATAPSVFSGGFLSIFNFEVATNHFLNTVLTKLCAVAAGDGELTLRLPSLAGYGLYLWFSGRILRRLAPRWIAFAGLLLLNLNPYVLDFFALSRGYGLSLGLMMASLFFFFRSLDGVRAGASSRPDLIHTLLCACLAVMANFAMLNVYLGIVALTIVPAVASGFKPATSANVDTAEGFGRRRRSLIWLALVAVVFSALVFSQDPQLSESLYEPVTITLAGLNETELGSAKVARVDLRGRETTLPRAAGAAVWQSSRAHFRAVRVELPAGTAERLARIEVIVGTRAFSHDPHQPGAWIARAAGGATQFESDASLAAPRSRMPAFRPVMNWAGDGRYARSIAEHTALFLVGLAMLAVALEVAGGAARHAKLIAAAQWSLISSSVLWVAALAGSPLYLLRKESQLYFGGTRGLVRDTFYSLIESSFYGRTYHPDQIPIAFAVIVSTIAAFGIAAFVSHRRNMLRSVLPAACVLALMAIVSVSLVAQRLLFDTVYLTGRTALFYIPLYVLFLTLLCRMLADLGRIGRTAAGSVLVAALALSIYHFTGTANLQYTLDWRDDASTKRMMKDLEQIVTAEESHTPRAVLGVEWIYAPVAVYYAHRHALIDVDVQVAPYSHAPDFLYLEQRHATQAVNAIRTYPVARTVLVRAK